MKALNEMINPEKGKMLAELFPGEIEGMLNAIIKMRNTMAESKEEIVANWDNPLFTVEFWYRLATEVSRIVDKEKDRLLNPRLFAEKLFPGFHAVFTIHCIMTYANIERKDTKFWHLANALFNYE